jgi:hypothetical protein
MVNFNIFLTILLQFPYYKGESALQKKDIVLRGFLVIIPICFSLFSSVMFLYENEGLLHVYTEV